MPHDAGNGVITPEFLQNEFGNWKFVDNLPDDIPGLLEAITSGEGMAVFINDPASAEIYTAHHCQRLVARLRQQGGVFGAVSNSAAFVSALP